VPETPQNYKRKEINNVFIAISRLLAMKKSLWCQNNDGLKTLARHMNRGSDPMW
jgi:hypothetical protein